MIRRADDADVEAVVAVFEPSFATLDFLPRLHTHAEHLAYFGSLEEVYVYDDGRVRGFAALQADVLSHLYVAPDSFGAGIGAALLDEVKRRRPAGFELWVFQANKRARRFYEAHGCTAVRFTDGAGNEERTPDVLYEWRPQ